MTDPVSNKRLANPEPVSANTRASKKIAVASSYSNSIFSNINSASASSAGNARHTSAHASMSAPNNGRLASAFDAHIHSYAREISEACNMKDAEMKACKLMLLAKKIKKLTTNEAEAEAEARKTFQLAISAVFDMDSKDRISDLLMRIAAEQKECGLDQDAKDTLKKAVAHCEASEDYSCFNEKYHPGEFMAIARQQSIYGFEDDARATYELAIFSAKELLPKYKPYLEITIQIAREQFKQGFEADAHHNLMYLLNGDIADTCMAHLSFDEGHSLHMQVADLEISAGYARGIPHILEQAFDYIQVNYPEGFDQPKSVEEENNFYVSKELETQIGCLEDFVDRYKKVGDPVNAFRMQTHIESLQKHLEISQARFANNQSSE